jgi:hypothetical protein
LLLANKVIVPCPSEEPREFFLGVATSARKRKLFVVEKGQVMTYTKPELDVVGTASTLIKGNVGSPTDPGAAGLKIQDVVHSKLEEE